MYLVPTYILDSILTAENFMLSQKESLPSRGYVCVLCLP